MSADFSTALAASFAVRVRAQQGLLIALAAVAVTGASAAGASTTLLQERAGEVRYAIPAAVAYQMDHDTWRGMTRETVARLLPDRTRHSSARIPHRLLHREHSHPVRPFRRTFGERPTRSLWDEWRRRSLHPEANDDAETNTC